MLVLQFFRNNWDVLIFLFFSVLHIVTWLGIRGELRLQSQQDAARPAHETLPDRELGATTLSSSSSAGITAVSILIPASLLVIQFGLDPGQTLPATVVLNVTRSALWFLLSLFFGLFVLWLVPMRAHKFNVARLFELGIPFGIQLIALLVGMIRLTIGLLLMIQ